jgi:hypothetical protein
MSKRSLLAAAVSAAVGGLSAGPALAGEVTGNHEKEGQNQGVSWCSFSGHNDDHAGAPGNPGGQSQSYGQENKLGLVDPSGDKVVHPGTFCNPNKTPLPPQPNRDK